MLLHSNPSASTSQFGWALRSFAMLFALWMCIVPQVMSSSVVLDLCEEAGSVPLPLVEEEEVKQAGTQPPTGFNAFAGSSVRELHLPSGTARPHQCIHGEVPHLPPWC